MGDVDVVDVDLSALEFTGAHQSLEQRRLT